MHHLSAGTRNHLHPHAPREIPPPALLHKTGHHQSPPGKPAQFTVPWIARGGSDFGCLEPFGNPWYRWFGIISCFPGLAEGFLVDALGSICGCSGCVDDVSHSDLAG